MKIGLISDVHGNRIALEAVLDDLPQVDALVNAGDVVGYNPWPGECVDAMANLATSPLVPDRIAAAVSGEVPTVTGNHDRAVAHDPPFQFNAMAEAGVEYAAETLDDDQLAWLKDLPDERILFDGRLKVVHGHPENPDRYTYPDEFGPDLLDEEDVLVMGHTHVQHHETYDEGIIVNPGSVGQPRDRDPRAAYAVVDLDELTVEERRVGYDVAQVQQAIREAGLPAKIGDRLEAGR